MDKAEIKHFREQVVDVLDYYCSGRWTILMTIPAFMCLLPIAVEGKREAYRTTIIMHLQDLAEMPGNRKAIEDKFVDMIIEERDQTEMIRDILNAVERLKANGFELSVEYGVNHFYVDDDGPYTLKELIDVARVRCDASASAAWRRRFAQSVKRWQSRMTGRPKG